MADGGERGGDYVTFRELVAREEALRNEVKGYVNEKDEARDREMNSRFTNFGHEVAKQFVEERDNLRKELPKVEDAPLRQQVVEMARGGHGRGMQFVGLGMILLAIALMMHAPWVAKLLPF